MLELNTVNDVLRRLSARGTATVALEKFKDEWKPITGNALLGRVRAVVQTLDRWGIAPGDRVALVSENRWEWAVVDFAVLAAGAADVPLYQTLTPDQMGFILRDSGARAIFLSTREQFDKLRAAGEIPSLEHVAVFDTGTFQDAESFAEILKDAPSLEQTDDAFLARLDKTRPEDLASIIYTSGTTGDPKGVMLTHRNLASNLHYSTDGLNIREGDSSISFLPLSHALARHLDYAIYAHGGVIAYLPKFDHLAKAMKDVRPTIFLAVPRVFEKVRQSVEGRAEGFRKTILAWAIRTGARHREEIEAGKTPGSLFWKLANKLVYSKIREAFGGRTRLYVSGGAPLGKESAEWFLDVGIRIFEGYGMTETSPVISRNTFEAFRPGTVGTVIPNMDLRIADDGEVEVRGECIFAGYWGKEEATQKEFTEDGWFRTGDIGKLEEGFLSITDRKKELLKTSGGKYIAPQPIESKLKVDSLVGHAAIIGDNRKFVSAIISPNFQALESWAAKNGVKTGDRKQLLEDPKVKAAYNSIRDRVNGSLAHFETIKKICLVGDEWTVESGELTPSMKLKRRVLNEKYKQQIDSIYRD